MGICLLCDSLLDSFGRCPNNCDEVGGGIEYTDSDLWGTDNYQEFDDIIGGYGGGLDNGRDFDIY